MDLEAGLKAPLSVIGAGRTRSVRLPWFFHLRVAGVNVLPAMSALSWIVLLDGQESGNYNWAALLERCRSGGIGRRARLKIWWKLSFPCRFDSDLRHQIPSRS